MRSVFCASLLALGAIAADPPPAVAQQAQSTQDPPSPDEPKAPRFVKRAREVLDAMQKKGITPTVGTLVPGSGLAFGAELSRPRFWDLPFGGEVEGEISIRNYRQVSFRAGYLEHRHTSIELRGSDARLDGLFKDHTHKSPGFSLYVERKYRRLPGLSLFGDDLAGQAARADFGISGTTMDAVALWQLTSAFGIGGRVGTLSFELSPGTNDSATNAEVAFGPQLLDDGLRTARYTTAGIGAALDRRDLPGAATRGWFAGATVWHYASRTATLPSFTRYAADLHAYHAVRPRHVIAARLIGSLDNSDDQAAPFYLLPTLGGGHAMRGYSTDRLRGARLIASTIEYRWRVARYFEVAPFVDVGRVLGSPLPGTPTGVLTSPGIGLRVRNDKRVLFRVDLARGGDGTRISFSISPPF
jgi:surface antigen Omp85-like protein